MIWLTTSACGFRKYGSSYHNTNIKESTAMEQTQSPRRPIVAKQQSWVLLDLGLSYQHTVLINGKRLFFYLWIGKEFWNSDFRFGISEYSSIR